MNPLARHYSRFGVTGRVLLTGHSHQAWPDVSFDAQQRAWLDAAARVDDKWEEAARQAALVREGFARLLGDRAAHLALGQNTHELVIRWLSALPLARRRRLVTTDGEFHSARRQLDRLAETGLLSLTKVPARPAETLGDRLSAALSDDTAGVLVSSVLFETAEIVPGLNGVAAACATQGASLLVDAYHHLNVVPFDIAALGLESAFVTGGGYKYCQLGEANCFLRVPPDTRPRPVLTGWFAELEAIEESHERGGVLYGPGAAAFAGATYDPTAHYRAAAVFAFHAAEGLTAARLHAINRAQVTRLQEGIGRLDLDPEEARIVEMPRERRGGFLALEAPRAGALVRALRYRGIHADARGRILRLGPAPYVSDGQIDEAVHALGEVVRGD